MSKQRLTITIDFKENKTECHQRTAYLELLNLANFLRNKKGTIHGTLIPFKDSRERPNAHIKIKSEVVGY